MMIVTIMLTRMVPMLLIIVKLVRMVLKESDLIAEYCDDAGEDSFFFLDGWMLVRIVVTPGRQNPQCRSCFELPDERYFVVKHIFANSILSMK